MSDSSTLIGNNLFLRENYPPDKRPEPEVSPQGQKAKVRSSPNLALYNERGDPHEVLQKVLNLCVTFKQNYENGRRTLIEKWKKADNYYWMLEKESRLPELSRAKVAAASFYRIVRRNSDGAYLATFASDDLPVKFFPRIDPFDLSKDKQVKALKAEAVNKFAESCFLKQRIKQDEKKAKRAYHLTYKYSNLIAYVPYDYQVEKRKKYKDTDVNIPQTTPDNKLYFKHSKTGEVSQTPHAPESEIIEYDATIKDEVGFYPLQIENTYFDTRIEDLNRQSCFLWRSDINRPEIWAESLAGKFKNVDKITEKHKYQLMGYENQSENERRQDAGQEITVAMSSEMYERWQCWLMLPKIKITKNKKGEVTDLEWDQNAEPRRYVFEVIGGLSYGPIVVRFEESPYWSNNIPFIMAHSHDDDIGSYHRGLLEILDDNWVQEAVAKGQLMDNRTMMTFRPMQWLKGRVMNKSGRIDHNTIFTVTSQDAIKQLEVADISGTIGNTLNYLREESEALGQTPKFMVGEAMGGRTSASEFATIRDQSSAPALTDIKALNMQLWGGYMKKVLEYMPQFVDSTIKVDHEGQSYEVHPDSIDGYDFELKEVAIQEFDNKMTTRQTVMNLVQGILSNPMFQGIANPAGLFVDIMKLFPEISPNPEELLIKNQMVASLMQEWRTQQQQASQGGGTPQPPNVSPMMGGPPSPPMPPDGAALSAMGGQMKGM